MFISIYKYSERREQRQMKTPFSDLIMPNRILLLSKYTEIIMRNFLLHQTTFHKNTRNTSYFLMNKFITSLFSENLLISGLQTPIIITHRRIRPSHINGWKVRSVACEGREGGIRGGGVFSDRFYTHSAMKDTTIELLDCLRVTLFIQKFSKRHRHKPDLRLQLFYT